MTLLTKTSVRDTDYDLVALDKNGVSKSSKELSEGYIPTFTGLGITSYRSKSTIRDTLIAIDELLSWGPNWNSYDALEPNPIAVKNAKNIIVSLFQFVIVHLGSFWIKPNISASPEGEAVFEWRYGNKKLTIYIGDRSMDYVQVWGTDIHAKITDGEIEDNYGLQSLWIWLIS